MIINNLKNLLTTKTIIGFILIVSIGANAYYFGNQWFQKEKIKAFNNGVMYVFQQSEKLGRISITIDGKTINLILSK